MPITRSAKKAARQSLARRARNVKRNKAYLAAAKNLKKYLAEGSRQSAEAALPALYKALDKAAKTGAIKKNKANRLKSRLTKLISRSGAQS